MYVGSSGYNATNALSAPRVRTRKIAGAAALVLMTTTK